MGGGRASSFQLSVAAGEGEWGRFTALGEGEVELLFVI